MPETSSLSISKGWIFSKRGNRRCSSIVGAELSFFGSCFLLKNDAYMKYRLEPLAGRDGGLRARNADPSGWRAQVLEGKPLTSQDSGLRS